MRPVKNSEIDPGKHRTYFAVVGAHSEPLGAAMLEMSRVAAIGGRTLTPAHLATAAEAAQTVSDSASTFLRELSGVQCPDYVRGAHDQLVDALRRIIRAGQAGAAAVSARSATGLVAAGNEINTAAADVEAVAQRFTDWSSGAARHAMTTPGAERMVLYRSMREDSDGRPLIADTANGLGVRDGDLDIDEDGIGQPETGGMSCAPSIDALPVPFRPPSHGGTGKYPAWALEEDSLGDRLAWRPDPDDPERHLFLEPSRPMHMDEYREALWETRDEWEKCD